MYASSIPVRARVTAGSEPSGQLKATDAAAALAVGAGDAADAVVAEGDPIGRSADGFADPPHAALKPRVRMAAVAARRDFRLASMAPISLRAKVLRIRSIYYETVVSSPNTVR
jgi:hypothetical protein